MPVIGGNEQTWGQLNQKHM